MTSAPIGRRPTVLVSRRIGTPGADDALAADADVVVAASPAADDLIAAIGEAEGMIAIRPSTVTREVIEAAPRLKVISALGSGCDHVDVEAASDHGIAVTSGAGVASGAVAEFVLAAMVVGHRNLFGMHRDLVAGEPWGAIKGANIGPGLEGATVGVVGYGQIGRLVATRLVAGFLADVIVYDPFVDPATAATPDGIRFTSSLTELVEASGTVTVHVPLTPETQGLLGAAELEALGSDGLLVQASRGGVVDEPALLAALEAGTIKGAVIDVFEQEPPPTEQLAALAATGRVLLTPHMASFTRKAVTDLGTAAVRDVLAVLGGELPPSVVNRDAVHPQESRP